MALAVLVAAEAWRRGSIGRNCWISVFLIPGIVFAVSISLVASIFELVQKWALYWDVALLVAIPLVTTQLGLSQIDMNTCRALMGLSEGNSFD